MYINFEILKTKAISLSDLMLLQVAKQNKYEDLSHIIKHTFSSNDLDNLVNLGLLELIKGSKNDSLESRIRISKKGSSILDDIETPEVLQEDIMLFDWISDVYLSLGKEIGNKKKTKMYIALFRTESGIEKNHLATLLEKFVKDESNMEYNFRLEYAFFKPTNVYQTRFDINQSRLYSYYLKNKRQFDSIFERIQVEAA